MLKLPVATDFKTDSEWLQEVYLHGNLLTRLPEELGQLEELEKLSVSGNRLTELPKSLSHLVSLKELTAAGNMLEEVPETLSALGQSPFRTTDKMLGTILQARNVLK